MESIAKHLLAVAVDLKQLSENIEELALKVEQLSREISKASKEKVNAQKEKIATKATVLDAVFDIIGKSSHGATIAQLKKKTGLSPKQLSNALYKLSSRGKVVAKSKGIYTKIGSTSAAKKASAKKPSKKGIGTGGGRPKK